MPNIPIAERNLGVIFNVIFNFPEWTAWNIIVQTNCRIFFSGLVDIRISDSCCYIARLVLYHIRFVFCNLDASK